MSRKLPFAICFFIFQIIFTNSIYAEPPEVVKKFAYDSLGIAILHSLDKSFARGDTNTPADAGGLIILLGEIDNDDARNLLVQLLEVYIGEANYEALSYSVVRQGKSIRKRLKDMLSMPVTCSLLGIEYSPKKDSQLRCLTVEDRNRRINRLIDMIDKNVELQYVL
jgi:hypothetical protein